MMEILLPTIRMPKTQLVISKPLIKVLLAVTSNPIPNPPQSIVVVAANPVPSINKVLLTFWLPEWVPFPTIIRSPSTASVTAPVRVVKSHPEAHTVSVSAITDGNKRERSIMKIETFTFTLLTIYVHSFLKDKFYEGR